MTTMTQTQAMTQTQGTTVTSVTPVTKKPRYPRRALLAEVQVVDGKEEELSKAILFQVKPWDETEYGASERLTGNRLAMCGIQQGQDCRRVWVGLNVEQLDSIGKWTPGNAYNKLTLRPTDLDGIEKKLEAVMNGLGSAIIRDGGDGRVPMFLSFKDIGKTILTITLGGPLAGYSSPLAEIQLKGRQIAQFPGIIAWMKSRITEVDYETIMSRGLGLMAAVGATATPTPTQTATKTKKKSPRAGKNIATGEQLREVMDRKAKEKETKKPLLFPNPGVACGDRHLNPIVEFDPLMDFITEDIINEIARGPPQ